jgi:hypothetical protein
MRPRICARNSSFKSERRYRTRLHKAKRKQRRTFIHRR